jgi:hypothetical protein
VSGLQVAVGVAMVATGVGALFGAALITTGVAGLVSTLLTPDEQLKQQEGNKLSSVRGSKERLNQNGYVPVLFGRHFATPDLAMPAFTKITGDDMYLCQLFVAGYNDMDIKRDTFKLGETPFTDFSKTKDINQILNGSDPFVRLEILADGEASQICPACVHEAQVNAEVRNNTEKGERDDRAT